MATEAADIPVPLCESETRGEEVAHFVDNDIKISVSKLPLEKQTQDDKYNELPAVEGGNFLTPPSIVEAHSEINKVSRDAGKVTEKPDQTVELAAVNQQNVEESSSTEIVTSDPDVDEARVVTQLSKDTIDHHGTNESCPEDIAICKEILQETSLPSEETESHAPCVSEVEEPDVQVKATDNKSEDEKPTEEDLSCDLTNEVSGEEESDQNTVTSELQSKSDSNTLSESHGDAAANHSDQKLIQAEDSQIEHDEHLEVESVRCPLTAVSAEETNDNVLATTDKVKVEDEEHKGAELSENEPSTACTSVQEDRQIEIPAESLHATPENIEVSNLSQEKSIEGVPEEQSTNETQHGNTTEAEEATIDAFDQQKKSPESFPPIAAEEERMNAALQEVTSVNADEKIEEVDKHKEAFENLSTDEAHSEINNVSPDASKVTEKPDQIVKDDTEVRDQPVELAAEEGLSTEENLQNVEESNSTEIYTSDPDVDDARVVTQLSKDTSIDHHGTNESYTENIALSKEILQESSLPSEETESHAPCISEVEEPDVQVKATDDKSPDEKPTQDDLSCDLTNEASGEEESDQNTGTSEKKVIANERSAEDDSNTAAEEGSQENSASREIITELEASNTDELQSKSDSNSSFSKEEDYGVPLENPLSESHGDVECRSKTLENADANHSDPKLIKVEDSQIEHDEHLEVESARCPLTAVSAEEINDNVLATTDNVKDEDEDHKGADLSENELSTTCTLVKEDRQIEIPAESLLVGPENIEVSKLSQEYSIEGVSEEQSTNETLHGNTTEAEETTIDAVDQQKKSPENLSTDEAHSEIINVSPDVGTDNEKPDQTAKDCHDTLLSSSKLDDQPVEFSANEETSVEQIQQNAEESRSMEKDGDKGVVPEHCSTDSSVVTSEMKVGDSLDDPDMDDARVVTQLSNDTGSDHHGIDDSFPENIALTEEILQETSLSCEEIESHTPVTPCISEGGELNVHVKTTDNSGDEKTTEDNVSCNLTGEVSKDGESDQNEMTSDQEVLANERNVEDSFNIAAEEVSQENNASTETITSLETSNSEESKSDLNLSLSKEEETAVQKGDESVTTPEDSKVLLEKTLSDSHGEEESQSETVQDDATEHSYPTHEDKSEESSLIQVDNSQIERDEQLEEEGERLPLTEALTGDTNDNIPRANEESKDEDKDLEEADLYESEESSRCTSVKEDVQIENHGESLHEAPENTEVSNLCQERNIKGSLEEESTNANLLGNTTEAEEATIGVVDQPKESLENPSTNLSTEDAEGNLSIELDSLENKNEEDLGKESEMTSLPLPLEREVSDASKFLHEARFEDGEPKETEFCDNEIGSESRNEDRDVTSEDTIAPNLGQETEKTSAIEEQNLSTYPQVILDKISDCGSVDATEEKEGALENLPTIAPNEKTEENSYIQDDGEKVETENSYIQDDGEKVETDEHSEKEIEQLSLIKDHTENVNNDEVIGKDDVKIEDESVPLPEEVQSEKPVESLHAAPEDVKTSDFGQNTETTENSQVMLTDETDGEAIDAANTNGKTQELQNGLNEESNEDLLSEVDASETKHDSNLEEESEKPSLAEASKEGFNDEESTILLEPETGDECLSKVELPHDEKSIDITTPKKDNLQDAPEGHKTSTSSSDIETTGSLEEQSLAENSQANKIIDADNEKELALKNVATEIPQEHIEEREQEECLEKDNQNSLTEAPIEETNARESTNIDELKNQDEDSIKPELEIEEKTESILVEEEADVEKPAESLQVMPEDVKQHDSSLDIENSTVEQIPTTDPLDISVDNTEGESVDTAFSNEKSLQDIAKTSPDCDNEDNIPKEEVGLLKPSIEASEGNPNDEQTTKIIEGSLIKEEESIKSLQVAAQDINTPPLVRHRETSSLDEQSLVTTPEGIMHDKKEEIADNAIGLDDEPPKDKNIANTTPYEVKEENLQIQEDCSQLEQNVDLGYDGENTPDNEAPIMYTTESSPVKEEENAEKCIEEQIPTADPQETCDKTEEKTVDAANEKNVILEGVVVNASNGDSEDNSPIEVDGSQKPSSEEVLAEKINVDEPTTTHEADFANENAVKEHLFEDAIKIESDLVKEEVYFEPLQVADEDIKDTSLSQDREASHLEEHPPTTDSHITTGVDKDEKTLNLNDPEVETLEVKNYATTQYEDTKEDSLNQVDSSLLETKEHSEKDSESTSFTDYPKDDTAESTLNMEVATEDITSFAPCQDTGKSSTEELILDPEDISSNKTTEKIIDATGEESQEAQDIAKSVPHEDDSPDEKNVEATLIRDDVSVELPQAAPEDLKQTCLSEVTETIFQEEQILSENPRGLVDNREINTIDPIFFQKETPKDEVPKEIESADFKATPITELEVEEGYLNDHQEKSSNLTDKKTPYAEDLDVNEDVIGHISEVGNHKQQESFTTEVSEHMTTSSKHVSDSTILESEVSEENIDQVVGEAKNFSDKTDSEEIEVLSDGSIVVPTIETLTETDPRGCTEAEVQVPNEEKEAESTKQEAEIDQNIKETLLNNASEGVSESEEVNVEEKIDSINYEEEQVETVANDVLPVSPTETPEVDHSTTERELIGSEEPCIGKTATEDDEEIKNEKGNNDEKQACEEKISDINSAAPDMIEARETDVAKLIVINEKGNNDEKEACEEKISDINSVAPDMIEARETDVAQLINNFDNMVETAEGTEINEKGNNDEKEACEEKISDINSAAPDMIEARETDVAKLINNFDNMVETAEGAEINKKGINNEKEACEEKISDINSAAPDMIEARETDVAKLINNFDNIVETAEGTEINEKTSAVDIVVSKRSVTDFETKNDHEASETKETTPSSAKGQDVEENSSFTGGLTEEKSVSDEVAFAPGENKSGYESNNRVLESIAQDQSCDIISETGDENLKAEAEIESGKAVSEDINEQETAREKEIMKDDILSEKEQLPTSNAEDEDVKDYDQGSCAEEVITENHQEDEVNQEQHENNKVTDKFIKDGNEIETVDDKAPEDLTEKISTNEVIDSNLHQEEQAESIEEPTTKIDTEKAQELDIASVQTDTQDSNEEGVQTAIIPGKESEEHNKKDEICSSDEVQAKDETSVLQENLLLSEGKSNEGAKEADTCTKPNEDEDKEAYVEAKKMDFASQMKDISECEVRDGAQDIPENNENFTFNNKFSEEDYPSKSTEFEVSSASENIALAKRASEATIVTTEVQDAKAGIDLGAGVPKATELENPEVAEKNDKCAAVEAESQQTKLHDLAEGLNIRDSEEKMAEKDESVNLQSVRDISEDVQELSKESREVPNNENPVEGGIEEKIETSEGQETKSIQNATISETRKHEAGEQQLRSNTEDVHEEHKQNSITNQLQSPSGTETATIPESTILQSAVENTAQHDKKEGSQQIDTPPFLPQAQCSENKTSENDLPVHVAGLGSDDVTKPEISPLPLKDKHVVLEADDTRNFNPENLGGNKNISTEGTLGELEIVKPSKVEKEEAECGNEEGTYQEREGNPELKETDKASLSEFFQVSTRDESQMADHSATEKEPTSHTEDLHAENSDEAEHENLKTDEEKDDEEESHEQRRSELGSEAPVIVEMGDADVKVAHKKSHNILSGVGSKVKHSIAKVKKAIIGKSSNPKTPSPKKSIN